MCTLQRTLTDHAQNTTNRAISLVVNYVIPLLTGSSTWASITSIMYHKGEGTRPCPFPVTGNGDRRVTEPKGNQVSGRNLGMIPKILTGISTDININPILFYLNTAPQWKITKARCIFHELEEKDFELLTIFPHMQEKRTWKRVDEEILIPVSHCCIPPHSVIHSFSFLTTQ